MSRTTREKPQSKRMEWCNPLGKWINKWCGDCFSEYWLMRGKYKKRKEDKDYRDEMNEAMNE